MRRPAMQPDARACFLRACALDVAVFKPGNVSFASPGHGMSALQFIASAQAAAEGLFQQGTRVGERIEAAVAASRAAAGCNTNLGILLLCAPIAAAVEREPLAHTPALLRRAIEAVLAGLERHDAAAAYRGIALANPGGLGAAADQDVRDAPSLGLREAMALAADRDLIARQYRDGYADLFELALPNLPPGLPLTNDAGGAGIAPRQAEPNAQQCAEPQTDPRITAAVQRLYLILLSRRPDSHIVRKHGEAMAQNVMREAQAFAARAVAGETLVADHSFMAWDSALKTRRINPGTTADMTVAALMLAGLTGPGEAASRGAV